jgi:hypothetical protein
MCGRAQAWENEINQLQNDYGELVSEMRQAQNEQAAVTERLMHPDGRLN